MADASGLMMNFVTTYGGVRGQLSLLGARYDALLEQAGAEGQVAQFGDEKTLVRSVVLAFDGTPAFPPPSGDADQAPCSTGDSVVVLDDDELLGVEGLARGTVAAVSADGIVTVELAAGQRVKVAQEAVRRPDGQITSISDDLSKMASTLATLRGDGETDELQRFSSLLQSANDDWRAVQAKYRRLKKEIMIVVEYRQDIQNQIQNIMADQKKMMEWATAQLAKLEAARGQHDDMKRMCDSLMKNRAVAEQNFVVLQESAQHHMPDPLIDAAMKELWAVWRNLQVQLFEETLSVLREEGRQSNLGPLLKRFTEFGKERVQPFLNTMHQLLEAHDEGTMPPEMRSCLQTCTFLRDKYAPHQLIVEHLSDVEVRHDVTEQHYKHLRTSVMADITAMCAQFGSSQLGYKDRHRYERSVENLRIWLNKTAQDPKSWQQAQHRLAELQSLATA
eukprot:TRINITY_DN12177_c0_g1_i1.p1 TRINITY_DN12177_c0_g1~~TRINITY_DN12177_c0_g1_i1.p1  ORF type:complete len:448 (+),score=190.47 TRINITY_DN12177_c0_g1_i1:67-1410(+)